MARNVPTFLFVLAVAVLVSMVGSGSAVAQQAERAFATEPTGGVRLPLAPLAGEHDALSTVVNPAGLWFLRGGAFGAALDLDDEDEATDTGAGLGFYTGGTTGGGVLPRTGIGVGLEFLRSSREVIEPDPGTPLRLTLAGAVGLGDATALGVSWHRFWDDDAPALDGVGTWDLGLATRLGPHLAAGIVVRDLGAPVIADVPVQRRYEAELVGRPDGTDRLELALGGRIGEIRADVDGWARFSWRVVRGMYLEGEVAADTLSVIERTPAGRVDSFEEREWRATFGVELSFGGLGAAGYARGSLLDDEGRLGGGTIVVRTSQEHVPSLLGRPERIERIELTGELDERKLTRLVLRLRAIARDEAVVAVFLDVDGVGGGWATAEEIRDELMRVRKAGKKLYAYLVHATTKDYYVASAADEIYVDPAGGVRLVGFAGTSIYFEGLLDQLGVQALFERIEEYKSAPESYTRSGPTEPALRMRNELYDSLYARIVAEIAASRGLDEGAVRDLVDGGPYTAGDLESDTRLVDAVLMPDEIDQRIRDQVGDQPVGPAPAVRPDSWDLPEVAVIYIEGDIVDGKSQRIPVIDRRLVGSETIAEAIAAARENPDVDAIVLRIDSPGGSALASEMMSREVFKTRGVKPILCSMGDVAASGGYFAAAGCEQIFALPTTITGSIGIFYGKVDVSGLMEKVGLSWVTYTRGDHAAMESMFRSYTEEERALIRDKMRYLYGRFTQAVAEGRGLTQERVDEVGRGRVWTGVQARPIELVDRFGGLADAIDHAKVRIGLRPEDRVRVLLLPVAGPSLLERILGLPGLGQASGRGADATRLPGVERLLRALPGSLLHDPDSAQARLPFSIIWE